MFPKVNFKYSQIYDRIISEMSGGFNDDQSIEIENLIDLLGEKWLGYEQKVYEEINKYPPFKLKPELINCYLVKNLPYTGFSDPLTIKINSGSDLDLIIATLIHELIHISMENEEVALFTKIKSAFPEVTDDRILLHIVVNFIEHQILKKLFAKDTFDKIMERELRLKGIRPAWDIVLTNEEKLLSIFV